MATTCWTRPGQPSRAGPVRWRPSGLVEQRELRAELHRCRARRRSTRYSCRACETCGGEQHTHRLLDVLRPLASCDLQRRASAQQRQRAGGWSGRVDHALRSREPERRPPGPLAPGRPALGRVVCSVLPAWGRATHPVTPPQSQTLALPGTSAPSGSSTTEPAGCRHRHPPAGTPANQSATT